MHSNHYKTKATCRNQTACGSLLRFGNYQAAGLLTLIVNNATNISTMVSYKIFVVAFIAAVIAVSAGVIQPVSPDNAARKEESVRAVGNPVVRETDNSVRSYGYGYYDKGKKDKGKGKGYYRGHGHGHGHGHGYGHEDW
jgi:hypothetical protein